MLHKAAHDEFVRLLSDAKFFCVTKIAQDLLLTSKSGSITLLVSLKPLPEHALHAKLDPTGGERYLQTKIRAKVRDHLESLRPKVKLNVNKNSGVLDPTVQIRLF